MVILILYLVTVLQLCIADDQDDCGTSTLQSMGTLVQLAMIQQPVNTANMNTNNCTTQYEALKKINDKLDSIIADRSKDEEKLNRLITTVENLTTIIKNVYNESEEESLIYPSSSFVQSCEEFKNNWPDSPSDYYTIIDCNGHPHHVYCHMEDLCDSKGGWMRVAHLNMSNSTEECPPGLRLYDENGVRACGRPESSPAGYCQSVKFPSYSINYTQVCGRVTGYQYGSPDAISATGLHNNLNAAYVDGVSLTHGNPRQHIWTFMAGLQEHSFEINGQSECPCAPNSPVTPQSFVGNDYFCESGNSAPWQRKLYPDPLWDGKQCGLIDKPCCLAPGIPWFHKTFDIPTTDYIELRVCGDQNVIDEDIPVGFYEIYVK